MLVNLKNKFILKNCFYSYLLFLENQIRVFLNENNGPGIQHIGLYTPNIINSVAMSKLSNNLVTYYVPPDGYYEDVYLKLSIQYLVYLQQYYNY